MNHYKDSNGKSWTTQQINRKSDEIAKIRLFNQAVKWNYNFCESCGINGNSTRLDVAHIISRKEAKESGRCELCWDINNMKILCRKCHQNHDKLNLQW